MPSVKHKALRITTTGTFQIESPNKPKINARHASIESNRAVLEKMLP